MAKVIGRCGFSRPPGYPKPTKEEMAAMKPSFDKWLAENQKLPDNHPDKLEVITPDEFSAILRGK